MTNNAISGIGYTLLDDISTPMDNSSQLSNLVEGYQREYNTVVTPPQKNEPVKDEETVTTPETPKDESSVTTEEEETVKEDLSNILDRNEGSEEDKKRAASKYLQEKLQLTPEQAAGLIGSFTAESHFNIDAANQAEMNGKNSAVASNQYGIGIGQWTGTRHDDYLNFIKSNGGQNNLRTQLDFAIDEINNKYGDYLANLRNAKNVRDASAYTYAQYTAANHTGIKDTDDLYKRVNKIVRKYQRKHKELYGTSKNGFEERVNYALQSIYAKRGTLLPKIEDIRYILNNK